MRRNFSAACVALIVMTLTLADASAELRLNAVESSGPMGASLFASCESDRGVLRLLSAITQPIDPRGVDFCFKRSPDFTVSFEEINTACALLHVRSVKILDEKGNTIAVGARTGNEEWWAKPGTQSCVHVALVQYRFRSGDLQRFENESDGVTLVAGYFEIKLSTSVMKYIASGP